MTAFSTVPIKYVATINRATLAEATPPDSSIRYADIGSVGRGNFVREPESLTFGQAPSRARRVTAQGDVLISTVRTYLRAVAQVGHEDDGLIASTGFATLTPNSDVDSRFLYYAISADSFVEEVVARSVGVSYPAIAPTDLSEVPIPVPPLEMQRRIADYLDTETARIDRLIDKNDEVLSLLDERRQALISRTVIGPPGREYPNRPLRYIARRVTVGIVVEPAKLYVEEGGVPALRGQNVQPGEVTPDDVVHISEPANRAHGKSILGEGDVVVVRTGKAGAAAVVPAWAVGGNAIDLLIVSPGPDVAPRFLEYALNSDLVKEQVAAGTVGAIQGHFNVATLREIELPVPDRSDQARAVQMLDVSLKRQTQLSTHVRWQQLLLQERRRALITAAATGELEV